METDDILRLCKVNTIYSSVCYNNKSYLCRIFLRNMNLKYDNDDNVCELFKIFHNYDKKFIFDKENYDDLEYLIKSINIKGFKFLIKNGLLLEDTFIPSIIHGKLDNIKYIIKNGYAFNANNNMSELFYYLCWTIESSTNTKNKINIIKYLMNNNLNFANSINIHSSFILDLSSKIDIKIYEFLLNLMK